MVKVGGVMLRNNKEWLREWNKGGNIEEKLDALVKEIQEHADTAAGLLNSSVTSNRTPLIEVLCSNKEEPFSELALEQITKLLEVESYNFTKCDNWQNKTLFDWAIENKQFSVAKKIIEIALKKNNNLKLTEILTDIRFNSGLNRETHLGWFLYCMSRSFLSIISLTTDPALEKSSHRLQMLSELLDLLEFLNSKFRNSDCRLLDAILKAYKNIYCRDNQAVIEPEKEIERVVSLYAEVLKDLPDRAQIEQERNKLIESSLRSPLPFNSDNFRQGMGGIFYNHCLQQKVSSTALALRSALNLLLAGAVERQRAKSPSPLAFLLENIKEQVSPLCSMDFGSFITPFAEAAVRCESEEKDDNSPFRITLQFIQETIENIVKEPESFTPEMIQKKVTENGEIPDQMREETQKLLCKIHKEAILSDCYKKMQKVKTFLKDSSLLPSTKQCIERWIAEAEEKKNGGHFELEDAEDFKKDIGDLPMPMELKVALTGLIGSLAALALLTAASMTVVPAVAVGIVSLGGSGLGLFKSQNDQQQLNAVIAPEKKEERPLSLSVGE